MGPGQKSGSEQVDKYPLLKDPPCLNTLKLGIFPFLTSENLKAQVPKPQI